MADQSKHHKHHHHKHHHHKHHHNCMVLHDTRVKGQLAPFHGYLVETDKTSSVAGAIHSLASWARLGLHHPKKQTLYIIAHGRRAASGPQNQSYVPALTELGYGLAVGQNGLTLGNVSLMKELYNLVNYVVLYACGPANTAAGNEDTLGDGNRFCTEMACNTGAIVIASNRVQHISRQGGLNFRAWRPPVFEYKPDGSRSTIE
jgi:hypothetical protein